MNLEKNEVRLSIATLYKFDELIGLCVDDDVFDRLSPLSKLKEAPEQKISLTIFLTCFLISVYIRLCPQQSIQSPREIFILQQRNFFKFFFLSSEIRNSLDRKFNFSTIIHTKSHEHIRLQV